MVSNGSGEWRAVWQMATLNGEQQSKTRSHYSEFLTLHLTAWLHTMLNNYQKEGRYQNIARATNDLLLKMIPLKFCIVSFQLRNWN